MKLFRAASEKRSGIEGGTGHVDSVAAQDLRVEDSLDLRELNQLDPNKVWTWDPASGRPYRGYPKKQLPKWHVYWVELYSHFGQLRGILDRYGNELAFPSAFRLSRVLENRAESSG